MTSDKIPRDEIAKVKYNNLFHEIKTEEQIQDIKKWVVELQKTKPTNCHRIISLWNDYDDKWYAPLRKKKIEDKKSKEAELLAKLQDRGDDYLDAVMVSINGKGEILSVPRNHLWSSRLQADGVKHQSGKDWGLGIGFRYPLMERHNGGQSKYGDDNRIRGLLYPIDMIKTFPCYGFNDRDTCTLTEIERPFVGSFTSRHSGSYKVTDESYKCLWRKSCVYRSSRNAQFDLEPIFDKDVQMWLIGEAGYYLGEPEFPDYWLECKKFPKDTSLEEIERGMCDSAVRIGENLYFTYSFSHQMFWEHREIQNAIKKKLENFIILSQQ